LGIGRINYQFVANSGRFGIWKLVGIQGAILFPILAYGSNYGLCRDIYCAIFFVVIFTAKGTAGSMSGSSRCRLTRPNVGDPLPSLHGHYTRRFLSVGRPFAGKAVVGGPYLPEEIHKMILAVGSLSDIIHIEIKPTFDAAKSSIENWQQEVHSEGVPAFAAKLSSSAEKLVSESKRIDDIISANTRYDREIRLTVHDRDPGPFVRELGFFASDISKTVELPPQTREAILTNDLARLRPAIITYDNWVYASTDNADYKVQALRAYRSPESK
jgi:hypothetical protein